ncbi:hypothetical protein AVEN_202344-1 [Araneus ventricosus]|uniref:Uncharacterized protein n=1 Tax=Araneus ventricosus TaxID=182803 RepID=A0A4Y2E5D2_ARAVE|nr:hypothetical protein AVEN_202344-1 [Araneus ventricosus]
MRAEERDAIVVSSQDPLSKVGIFCEQFHRIRTIGRSHVIPSATCSRGTKLGSKSWQLAPRVVRSFIVSFPSTLPRTFHPRKGGVSSVTADDKNISSRIYFYSEMKLSSQIIYNF